MFKAIDRWLLPWIWHRISRRRKGVTDLVFCVCDHFEPFHRTDKDGALRRMAAWQARLPGLTRKTRDADGCGARHTFFYPVEQYDRDVLGNLADLCRATQNETEIHLHHENDTLENLKVVLTRGVCDLRYHGLLGGGDNAAFGFIHGNWALDDSDPQGVGCGVRDELRVLKSVGCFGDFTMPSAPHRTQAPIVNALYYARSTASGCSHHHGRAVACGNASTGRYRKDESRLLLVQGPLCLDFGRRKMGVFPRIENSDLGPRNPPNLRRLRLWMQCGISVQGAEEWCFVKVHTHGAHELGHASNLGPERARFHAELEQFTISNGIRLHYVSARELVNILHAAEDGMTGDAGLWRNYLYAPPPLLL